MSSDGLNREQRRFMERRLLAQKKGLGPAKIIGQEPKPEERVQNGDLVYFKTIQKNSRPDSMKARFNGMGFGMLLGEVPNFAKDPSPEVLIAIMGAYGFVLFDDVADFAGDEVAEYVVKKHTEKYAEHLKPQPVEAPAEPSRLVSENGTPIEAPKPEVPDGPA